VSYRGEDLRNKLMTIFPPSTTYQCALIYLLGGGLDDSSTVSEWLALEVNASNRPTFTTPASSGYGIGSFFTGAYFNFSLSVTNPSGSLLEWSRYLILDGSNNMKTYLNAGFSSANSSTPANSTNSRNLTIKLEYQPPSTGG
jgi:hypothetical protein